MKTDAQFHLASAQCTLKPQFKLFEKIQIHFLNFSIAIDPRGRTTTSRINCYAF